MAEQWCYNSIRHAGRGSGGSRIARRLHGREMVYFYACKKQKEDEEATSEEPGVE